MAGQKQISTGWESSACLVCAEVADCWVVVISNPVAIERPVSTQDFKVWRNQAVSSQLH